MDVTLTSTTASSVAADVGTGTGTAIRRERQAQAAAVALVTEWPELRPLSHLVCELAIAEIDGLNPVYAPMLMVNPKSVRALPGHGCEWCCHWDAPLRAPYAGRATEHSVGLVYAEWLVYHFHVCRHQRLDRGVA